MYTKFKVRQVIIHEDQDDGLCKSQRQDIYQSISCFLSKVAVKISVRMSVTHPEGISKDSNGQEHEPTQGHGR